jgi:hypothetical protein
VDNRGSAAFAPDDEVMELAGLPDPEWLLEHVLVPSADADAHAGVVGRRLGPVRRWQAAWEASIRGVTRDLDDSPLGAAVRSAVAHGGVLTRADAAACGLPAAVWRRQVRRGAWTPCGYGVVSVLEQAEGLDMHRQRRRDHALRALAAAAKRPDHAVGAASAAVVRGLPVLAVPRLPELVTASHSTAGRLDAVHVRRARLGAGDLDSWFGARITSLERTVVDVARFAPRSGLMAADAALHERLISTDGLASAIARCAGRPGIGRARYVLRLASPLIESPLESLTHLALHEDGLPRPKLQHPVTGADGRCYRVDFAWPRQRLALEADGRSKYRDDELWREKRRELALHRAGWRIARVRWADVMHEWADTRTWLRELLAADPSS